MKRYLPAVGAVAAAALVFAVTGAPALLPVSAAALIGAVLPFVAAFPAVSRLAPVLALLAMCTEVSPTWAPLGAALAALLLLVPLRSILVPAASTAAAALAVYHSAPVALATALAAGLLSTLAWAAVARRSTAGSLTTAAVAAVVLASFPAVAFTEGSPLAAALLAGAALAALVTSVIASRIAGPAPRVLAALATVAALATPVALVTVGGDEPGTSTVAASMQSCADIGGDTLKAVECYSTALIDIYRSTDLPTAIDTVKQVYAVPGRIGSHFAENCHESLHFLGKAVALDHQDDLAAAISLGTDMCSAGFGHGVWEMQYGSMTTAKLLDIVPTICRGKDGMERSAEGGAGIGCRHILGHTLATRYRGNVQDVAEVCLVRDPASDPASEWTQDEIISRNNCLAGLFMENNLDLNRFRGTEIDRKNPFFVCEHPKVSSNDVLLWGCYNEIGAMVVPFHDYEVGPSLQACKDQQQRFDIVFWVIESCYDSIARSIAPAFEYDAAAMEAACEAVADKELHKHCVKGIAGTITFNSNSVENGMRICTQRLTDPDEQAFCAKRVQEVADALGASRTTGDGDLPAPSGPDGTSGQNGTSPGV